MMTRIFGVAILLGLGGCAYDNYTGNVDCAGTAGCVSSFPKTGTGPIHAQAVAPDAPPWAPATALNMGRMTAGAEGKPCAPAVIASADQAACRALRRIAAPTRPKPVIIRAQLAGSGTAFEIPRTSSVSGTPPIGFCGLNHCPATPSLQSQCV